MIVLLLGAIALTYAALFGFAAWLRPTTQENSSDWRNWLRGPLIVGGALSPMAIAMAILARYAPRPKDTPPEFRCPSCRALLNDITGIIVATGKCPACLSPVLKADDPIPPGRPLFTIAELQAVKRSQFRALALSLLWLMFGPLAFLMVAFALALLAPDLATGGGAPSWIGPVILWITPFGGLMLAIVLYSWRMMIRCPCCRTLIGATSTIIASGNCLRCASPIVKDATPWSEYRPLPKFADVLEARGHYAQRLFAWLLGGVALGAMLLAASNSVEWLTLSQYIFNVLRVVLLFLGIATIAAPCVLVMTRFLYRRHPDLVCAHCCQPLTENSAALRCTGNCTHCGQRAIKDA